jgi:hypothetical protein
MTENDTIWEDLNIAEHRDEALVWAEDAFPQFLGNEALVAQLYFTNVMDKNLPPPVDLTSVEDLKKKFAEFEPVTKPDGKQTKLYATIEVVMVQLLDDKRGYFGCPKCYRKVDKNVGICSHIDHVGEDVKGVSLTFQKWQGGDNTGNVIVTFGPSSHQLPHDTQYYTLTLQGSCNNRDGSFNVWEILNKKSPKGFKKVKKLRKTVSKPEPKAVVEEPKEVPVVEDEKSDTSTSEEASEIIDDIFGEGEETKGVGDEGDIGTLGLSTEQVSKLTRDFKKLLKQHYTKKPNSFKNIIRWMVVQPQFREVPKGEEREAVVRTFLDKMEADGLYAFEDTEKEQVISKLE